MKFAFSTVGCPAWDFATVASRAREYGYDGVELRTSSGESHLSAANIFLSDLEKVRQTFDTQSIAIACLASSIAMTGKRRRDDKQADDLRRHVEVARVLGCPLVKVFDTEVRPGQSRASAGVELGEWLLPLGDYAASRDVTIVIENALSFRNAKELWTLLDRLQHPAIACCWDVFNAALVGESPYLSVPVLNSKIVYTQAKDAKLGSLGVTYCKLGEGDVPVRKFITRLRGIGYEGYVTFEWEKAWIPTLAEPEEVFPDAIAKLKGWAAEGILIAEPEPPKHEPTPTAA